MLSAHRPCLPKHTAWHPDHHVARNTFLGSLRLRYGTLRLAQGMACCQEGLVLCGTRPRLSDDGACHHAGPGDHACRLQLQHERMVQGQAAILLHTRGPRLHHGGSHDSLTAGNHQLSRRRLQQGLLRLGARLVESEEGLVLPENRPWLHRDYDVVRHERVCSSGL